MLSDKEKSTLRNRYAGWGLDAVKDDLKRPFRWVYGSRDRNEFALEWVQQTEQREHRRRLRRGRLMRFLALAVIVLVGLAIGLGGTPNA